MTARTVIRRNLARVAGLLGRSRRDRELDEELTAHLAIETDEYMRRGHSAPDARRLALLHAGGITAAKDACRDQRGIPVVEQLMQDLHFATRSLRRAPTFAVAVILSLGVGIGATSAVLTAADRVVLRPLAYGDAGRIVMLWRHNTKTGDHGGVISLPDYTDWVAQSRAIERAAAFNIWFPTLSGRGDPEELTGSRVGADFFRVLGVAPMLGRTFQPGEDAPGAPGVVVISHSLWVRRFGSDPHVIGRTITLNRAPFTVIGVMPANFRDPEPLFKRRADIWRGLALSPTSSGRHSHWLRAVARLKPGIALLDAKHDMDRVAAQLTRAYPDDDRYTGIDVVPIQEQVVGKARPILLATLAAALCVLLIVCSNVATLVSTRQTSRSGEIGVRVAMGAGRDRIVRLIMMESVLIACAGGALGLALAWVSTTILRHAAPVDLPRAEEIRPDAWIIFATAVLSIGAALLIGLSPALRAARSDITAVLQSGSRRLTTRGHVRRVAVAAEVAATVIVLASAVLLATTLMRIAAVPIGFDPNHVMSMQISLTGDRYSTPAAAANYFRAVTRELERLPGVESAGSTFNLPMSGLNDMSTELFGTDITGPAAKGSGEVQYRTTTPDYFRTMRMRLLRGRAFVDGDSAGMPVVAMINRTGAARYFPGIDPIGHRLFLNGFGVRDVRIIGVYDDVRYDGPMNEVHPEMFVPEAQQPWSFGAIAVRVRGPVGPMIPIVRQSIRAHDPSIAVSDLEPMATVVGALTARQRFYASLFAAFALVALLVSVVGIYGMVAYTIVQRRREIGIRLALGAKPGAVMRALVGNTARLVAIGLTIGVAGAAAATRMIRSLLYGVAPGDVGTLAASSAVLLLVALGAAALAARRAMVISPAEALRSE